MDIAILNSIIWIWKLTFEFWIIILESKIYISIQKIIDCIIRFFSTSVVNDKSLL
jgi:hypothetical protein